MISRRKARETAFQILYRYDLARQETGGAAPEGAILERELEHHFDHFAVAQELRPFASSLVTGTLAHLAELDGLLETHAKNWKVGRMAFVDRTLLRLAIFEMLHGGTPVSVAIDEALEMGKQFGTSETASFLNGILDAVARQSTPA